MIETIFGQEGGERMVGMERYGQTDTKREEDNRETTKHKRANRRRESE